jgi:tetratricopeptide (TPR) repeat protein
LLKILLIIFIVGLSGFGAFAQNYDSLNRRVNAFIKNKKFDEAEKQLLKAKELAKGSMPMIHWQLALLYENDLKKYGDAAKELKLFLKAQPDTKDAEKIKEKIKELEAKAAQG